VKSYVRNTMNLSCAKILLTSVISRQTGLLIVETINAACLRSYEAVFRLYAYIYREKCKELNVT